MERMMGGHHEGDVAVHGFYPGDMTNEGISEGLKALELMGKQWNGMVAVIGWDGHSQQQQLLQQQQQQHVHASNLQQQVGTRLRLCDFWSRNGNCLHGDNCKFFHDPNITPRPLKESGNRHIIDDGMRGGGKISDMLRATDKTNIHMSSTLNPAGTSGNAPRRVCDFFAKYGNCRSGRSCKFLHVAPPSPPVLSPQALPQQKFQQVQQQQLQALQLLQLQEQKELQASALMLTHSGSSSSSMSGSLSNSHSSNSLNHSGYYHGADGTVGGGMGLDNDQASWRDMESAMQDWRDPMQGRDSEWEDGSSKGWIGGNNGVGGQRRDSMARSFAQQNNVMVGNKSMEMAQSAFAALKQQQQHQQGLVRSTSPQMLQRSSSPNMLTRSTSPNQMMQQSLARSTSPLLFNQQKVGMAGIGGGMGPGLAGMMVVPNGPHGMTQGMMGGMSNNGGGQGGPSRPAWAVSQDGTAWFLTGDGWSHNAAGGRRRVCDFFDGHGTCRHGSSCAFLHIGNLSSGDKDVARLVENVGSLSMVGADLMSFGMDPEMDQGVVNGGVSTMGGGLRNAGNAGLPLMHMSFAGEMPFAGEMSSSGHMGPPSPSKVGGGMGFSSNQRMSPCRGRQGGAIGESLSRGGMSSDEDDYGGARGRGEHGNCSPQAHSLWGYSQGGDDVGRLGDYLRTHSLGDGGVSEAPRLFD